VTQDSALFTQRELDVMGVLWDHGSATVAEAKEKIGDRVGDDLAYTTVLTILRTLEYKGFVGHDTEGRAHRYLPLVTREDAQVSHLTRLVRKLFQGSPAALVQCAVGTFEFDPGERKALAKAILSD